MIDQSIQQSDFRSLQREVFRRLRIIYRGDDLISELSGLLNLQRAAVYKRASGETMIKFDELVMIAVHFNFSLESIFNSSKEQVSFKFDLLGRRPETYQDIFLYLKDVFNSFRNHADNTLIYSAKHLPFMHYLRYPLLFEIHMHLWNNTSFNKVTTGYRESNIRKLTGEDIEVMKYLNTEYEKHPMIEIWGPNILEDLYSKVRFLVLSNIIDNTQYLESITSNIKLLINHLKEITTNQAAAKLKVYINELELGTPMLFYESHEETKCFLIHQEPNFVYTHQKTFCEYSKNLLSNIINYSKIISEEGAKDRLKYFAKVDKRFENFTVEIQKVFDFAQLQ